MPMQRKVFRIEQIAPRVDDASVSPDEAESVLRHYEIMSELKALRAALERRGPPDAGATAAAAAQSAEFQNIRQELEHELNRVYEAINHTKQEIASLHLTGFSAADVGRVTSEIGAVVGGTEQATHEILAAAEHIERTAATLSASSNCEQQVLTQDIQNRVMRIFEACNFQDLTGQRLSRAVATMRFIEERIKHMMEIWGGLDAFKDFTPAAREAREGNAKLVNGPKLDGEPGYASQDDIDSFFDEGQLALRQRGA